MIKINSKKYQLFLIATNLIIKIKQVNNEIINLINNIKNNTISEIQAKENLNALNKIKKTEIKNKRHISNQKKLLVLFNKLLDTILTEDNNNNNSVNNNKNNDNDNNDNDNDNECESESENDYKIKQINNYFKMIDESKPFEDQIKLFKKADFLYEHWHTSYYDDDKELNLKIFKLKFAYISNDIDENLFGEVYGHTFVTLANK